MKKVSLFIILSILSVFILGCSHNTEKNEESGDATRQDSDSVTSSDEENETSEGFLFPFGDSHVFCDQSAEKALSVLGKYENKFESKSCAFNGVEVTYYYPSLQMTTYTDGDDPAKVLSIYLQDDSVSTAEGLTIGDSMEKVKEAYGKASESTDNSLVFEKGNSKLTFIFNEDGVSSIMYSLITG